MSFYNHLPIKVMLLAIWCNFGDERVTLTFYSVKHCLLFIIWETYPQTEIPFPSNLNIWVVWRNHSLQRRPDCYVENWFSNFNIHGATKSFLKYRLAAGPLPECGFLWGWMLMLCTMFTGDSEASDLRTLLRVNSVGQYHSLL